MKAIVAVDLNWAIGYEGNLLMPIPDDLKFFKGMTIGKVVVMGRETFQSLPGQKPLKDRHNIVLTKTGNFSNENLTICRSLDQLFRELTKYPTEDVFIIGGEKVYSQFLPYCTEAYVTKIEDRFIADKFFPNLDQLENWELESVSDLKFFGDTKYRFTKYVNKQIEQF
jgi:dihydrofolate reductase